jgi:hypothetical protein
MGAGRTAYGRLPLQMFLLFLGDSRNLYVRHGLAPSAADGRLTASLAARSAAQNAAEVKLYGLRERDFFASLESAARRDLMDVMSLTCLRKTQAASD